VTSDEPKALDWKPVQQPRPVTLRGRFVTLEPLDADRHSSALWNAVRGHDEVWTWLADGPYASESDLHAALAEKQASQSAVFLAILPTADDQLTASPYVPSPYVPSPYVPGPYVPGPHPAAGYASFMRIEPAHGVVEVGNILLSPILQRTTAATEAMYLMARHVFDDLGYRRYEWKCNAENEPSRRAALRLGFSFEGIFRQHMVIKDRNRDTAWFAMLDHEWPERKQAIETWLDPANFVADGKQRYKLAACRQAKRF
jgi:RimJ/RimL family protein N-acetyltransferase